MWREGENELFGMAVCTVIGVDFVRTKIINEMLVRLVYLVTG
jgi:hypothetical protein